MLTELTSKTNFTFGFEDFFHTPQSRMEWHRT